MDRTFDNAARRLPQKVLEKSIRYGNEYGWKKTDIISVIEAAIKIPMAIIGGQVMYLFPDGTCELYWLSYDSTSRMENETWSLYCNRSANECITKIKKLIATKNIEMEAIESFTFISSKKAEGADIDNFQAFMLYFDDTDSDL